MNCFRCGNKLPTDSLFCQFCGAELKDRNLCAGCGSELEEGMNFCPKCGTQAGRKPLTAAEPAPMQGSPAAAASAQSVLRVREELRSKREKKKKPVRVWLLCCLAAVLICGVVGGIAAGVALFAGNSGEDPADPAQSVLLLEVYDISNACIGTASGFLVGDGVTLVTNYSVLNGAFSIVAITADGAQRVNVGTILAYDRRRDLAILRCDREIGLAPLPLGDPEKIRQGDAVFAAEYPNTLSDGVVSGKYTEKDVSILQVTAAAAAGSALLNRSGEVIGIFSGREADRQELPFVIAVNEVQRLLESEFDEVSVRKFRIDSIMGNGQYD